MHPSAHHTTAWAKLPLAGIASVRVRLEVGGTKKRLSFTFLMPSVEATLSGRSCAPKVRFVLHRPVATSRHTLREQTADWVGLKSPESEIIHRFLNFFPGLQQSAWRDGGKFWTEHGQQYLCRVGPGGVFNERILRTCSRGIGHKV